MKNGTRFTPAKLTLLPGLLIILIAGLIWGYRAINHQALVELAGQSRNHLTLFVSNLNGALAKYEHLPRLISTNRRLVDTLGQTDIGQINQTNRYLELFFLHFVCLSSSFPLQVNDELKLSLRQSG
jgi:C4-dicarboxylate-specific signal transduction histidine kinase